MAVWAAMKPAPFDYHRPASLAETFDLLHRYGDDGRILAGGQSLVPALNMRLATPRALIDINRLPGLDAIGVTSEGLVIGALARHETVERSPLVREHAPLIAMAMPHVGHAAIRTRGTFGGSLALADPAAELPACVVALDATVGVEGRGGRREIAAADFFRGIYTTALEPGELVTEVVVPRAQPGWRFELREVARRHGDFALVGLAAAARPAAGALGDCRLVFFGVGPMPVRARGVETALRGQRIAGAAEPMAAAIRALERDLDPPGDVHGSPPLRRHLAGVLLARAVSALVEEAA
jgi:aerobic carbon-monoxide dehydrogenase medium subunit